MADSNTIDLGFVKALSKENRQWLASEIRKDSELWNAVNGMGGLSENSEKSRIQGTISKGDDIFPNARIIITEKEGNIQELVCNQLGYFKTDINPGDYQVKIIAGEQLEDVSVKTIKGITSTVNHSFK